MCSRPELAAQIRDKALAAGLYAANMPEDVGGAGLDAVTQVLFEKELGKTSYALHYTCVARPSNILLAGTRPSGSATCSRASGASASSAWR